MKKIIKIEYLLYLFIIITPFLDCIACLFREWFPDSLLSPATIIRPIIPLILLMYVFIKDKKTRPYLIISGLVLVLYAGIHLWIYKGLLTGISYGSALSEAQYLVNYTYMLYVLFLYLYFMKNNKLPHLKKSLIIMLCSYLALIYIAIISGTSYTTYIEGMGYRGWFSSGNSISTILIMLMCLLIPSLISSKNIKSYIILVMLGGYLLFLVGTRTGMLGFLLVLVFYFISTIILRYVRKKKVSYKKMVMAGVIFIILISLIVGLGSATLERRKHLATENVGIMDVNTGKAGYTTGDTGVIVYQIKNNKISDGYLSEAQKKAYLKMYEIANEKKFNSSNRRLQQLVYHVNLIRYQKNILYILFGNGYLASYGEMTLEMEFVAILFNFGLVGFLLYVGPFIILIIYTLKRCIKKIDEEIVMNTFGLLIAFGLSSMAGYVFFSVSCVLVMICMISLLYEKGEE